MNVTMMRAVACALVALCGALAAGCGGADESSDKAGGSGAPKVLRLASANDAEQPDGPLARAFASRVAKLSGGKLRVRVTYDAAGQHSDAEARIARMVRDGRFDLGWIGARAWDGLGVASLQALQAPFLVTSHDLMGQVATGPLAERMLAGLERKGFVGLALVPDRLRYFTGVRRALASPRDFDGARVRVFPSRTTDALVRALGATPVHLGGDDLTAALAKREMDGSEVSLASNSSSEGENHLTANLPLFPKTLTLFAERDAYGQLDDDQRAIIAKAAAQTAAHAAAHPPSESALIDGFCGGGRVASVVNARPEHVAALTRAAQPVYTQLERDSNTKALIAAVRALKAKTPVARTQVAARDCAAKPPSTSGRELASSTLNGTYRWRLSQAAATAAGLPDDPDIGDVQTMTLRDGKWLGGESVEEGGATGTYKIVGKRLIISWPEENLTTTWTFVRHGDGDLDLDPVGKIDPGDAFNWASARWQRIGPPVRKIP